MVALDIIRDWFRTGKKPTQQQFWDTWDSFFHKNDQIPIGNIENLNERFEEKADDERVSNHIIDNDGHNLVERFSEKASEEDFQNHLTDPDAHDLAAKLAGLAKIRMAPIPVDTGDQDAEGMFSLDWTPDLITHYGDFGHFHVSQGNSMQIVPITFVLGDDGKPDSYTFNLSKIDSLIYII